MGTHNEDTIRVSICVPVYGVENYIERCAISLFEQTYENIEYVFVDDCTTDCSIDILIRVIQRYPQKQKNIHIVRHEHNCGIAAVRNTLMKSATGDYLIFVDSDDFLEKDAVEKIIISLEDKQFDLVFSRAKRYYPDYYDIISYPKGLTPYLFLAKLLRMDIEPYVWGILIKRSMIIENRIAAIEGWNSVEDFYILVLLLLSAKSLLVTENVIYHYDCMNPYSLSKQSSIANIEENYCNYVQVYNIICKSKEYDFIDDYYIGVLKILSRFLLFAARKNNLKQYNFLKRQQYIIDKKYLKGLSIPYRVPLYFNNLKLTKYYYIFFGKIHHYGKLLLNNFIKKR